VVYVHLEPVALEFEILGVRLTERRKQAVHRLFTITTALRYRCLVCTGES
jgi:hypothetical protein